MPDLGIIKAQKCREKDVQQISGMKNRYFRELKSRIKNSRCRRGRRLRIWLFEENPTLILKKAMRA